jgi:hypothetical protein
VQRRRLVLAACVATLLLPNVASAINCPGSITDRLHDADVGFVGHLVSVTPVKANGGLAQFDYRFAIDKAAKGRLGREVTVHAVQLVDLDNRPLTSAYHDTVGVIASPGAGGRLVTTSCGLVDAGSLLGAADAPKGGTIKVLIGLVIAALVIGYSILRLRKRGGAPRPNPLG